MNTLRVSEIFGPTIQGEGALIGRPTVFVRLGGCDYRCSWCDTLYAVESKYRHDWTPMTAKDILTRVKDLSQGQPILITLSGGNPATQDCEELIKLGHSEGFTFSMETQGSIPQDWFSTLDQLTLSPKPPSSGMETNWDKLQDCVNNAPENTCLKVVVSDDEDYAFAKHVAQQHPHLPIFLQPCNTSTGDDQVTTNDLNQSMHSLIDRAAKDKWYQATILPQLHVYLWGNERGV